MSGTKPSSINRKPIRQIRTSENFNQPKVEEPSGQKIETSENIKLNLESSQNPNFRDHVHSAIRKALDEGGLSHVKANVVIDPAYQFSAFEIQKINHVIDSIRKNKDDFKDIKSVNIVDTKTAQRLHQEYLTARANPATRDSASKMTGAFFVDPTADAMVSSEMAPENSSSPVALHFNAFLHPPTTAHFLESGEETINHEIGHVKENSWADSLFTEYALLRNGHRIVSGNIGQDANGNQLYGSFAVPESASPQFQEFKKRIESAEYADIYNRQQEFLQDWLKVSAFSLKAVKLPVYKSDKSIKVEMWDFDPNKITGSKDGAEIIKEAFGNSYVSEGGTSVSKWAKKQKKGVSDSLRPSMNPGDELAEAVRIYKAQKSGEFKMDSLSQPAQVYLNKLFAVIEKHESVWNSKFSKQ